MDGEPGKRARPDLLRAPAKGGSGAQAAYPVDKDSCEPVCMLQSAARHEFKESEQIYPEFANIAREEGFAQIAQDFENIASIEKSHGERFRRFAQLYSEGRLYSSDEPVMWVCTNCGYIIELPCVPWRAGLLYPP